MTIGETLAEARQQAGLTVSQVSHQTRIREAIIRGIEQDDYTGCGGDFYARGHIRAMARAIGADPVPLIQEFDEANRVFDGPESSFEASGNVRMGPSGGEPGPGRYAPGGFQPLHRPSHPDAAYPAPSVFDAVDQASREPAGPGHEPYETEPPGHEPYETEPAGHMPSKDAPYEPAPYEPAPYEAEAATQAPAGPEAPRPPLIRQPPRGYRPPRPAPRTYQPSRRPPPQAPPPRPPGDREGGGSWLSSVFDSASPPETPGETTEPNGIRPTAAAAPAGYDRGGRPPAAPATATTSYGRPPKRENRENRVAIIAVAALAVVGLLAYLLTNVFSAGSPKPKPAAASTPTSHPRSAGASPSATPSHSTSPAAPPAPAAQTLHPASADAFGPGGVGHGDNQQYAAQAIDGSPSSSWQSDWYNTPRFGNLQPGTGLLLNMGGRVTVTSARITLGGISGADLQLRAGPFASLAALRPVAHANGAGGVVTLRISHPASARYLLVWFTKLPPDSTGTYQVKVYNITLKGSR